MFQRFGSSKHLDREPPESSCEIGYGGRRLEPAARRILVGASAVAVSMGTVEHAEVVSGHDADAVYHLGKASDSSRYRVALFRIFPLRLGRLLLARRHPPALLPPYAMLREQLPSP